MADEVSSRPVVIQGHSKIFCREDLRQRNPLRLIQHLNQWSLPVSRFWITTKRAVESRSRQSQSGRAVGQCGVAIERVANKHEGGQFKYCPGVVGLLGKVAA